MPTMYTVLDHGSGAEVGCGSSPGRRHTRCRRLLSEIERLPLRIGEERLAAEWSPEPGTVIYRFFRKDWFDRIQQSFAITFIFRVYRDGQLNGEERETFSTSYYAYPRLRALLLLAGLEPIAEYGWFCKNSAGE